MAITAVSKLQPRGAAQLIPVCQSLAVWKGRRQFDSRKTFPLLFTGSGWGGCYLFQPKETAVGFQCVDWLRNDTAVWNSQLERWGCSPRQQRVSRREKPHVCRLSQWNSRLGKHQGMQKNENIQGTEEEIYKRKAGQAALQNKRLVVETQHCDEPA